MYVCDTCETGKVIKDDNLGKECPGFINVTRWKVNDYGKNMYYDGMLHFCSEKCLLEHEKIQNPRGESLTAYFPSTREVRGEIRTFKETDEQLRQKRIKEMEEQIEREKERLVKS